MRWEVTGHQIRYDFIRHGKDFGYTLNEMGNHRRILSIGVTCFWLVFKKNCFSCCVNRLQGVKDGSWETNEESVVESRQEVMMVETRVLAALNRVVRSKQEINNDQFERFWRSWIGFPRRQVELISSILHQDRGSPWRKE